MLSAGGTRRMSSGRVTGVACVRRTSWETSGTGKGDVGDLGGTVEAERKAYGADASVDVELHVADLEVTLHVLLAHGREDKGADEGETKLAAVGVAGEHEVDEREAGMVLEDIDVVGLMDEVDDRGARLAGDGEVGVRGAGAGVIGAGDVEALHLALEGEEAVDQDGGAVGLELVHNEVGVHRDVVVAQDSDALGSFEAGKDLGRPASGADGDTAGAGTAADEVASE